jgi:hypothetical protein
MKTGTLPGSDPLTAKQAGRLARMPETFRRLFARCWAGQASPRAAIKAFCAECVAFDRAAVRDCGAEACALWRYRPYQRAAGRERIAP